MQYNFKLKLNKLIKNGNLRIQAIKDTETRDSEVLQHSLWENPYVALNETIKMSI